METIRPARKEAVLKAFEKIWSDLFSTPVHLDSALSKQSKHLKSVLAQIVPSILLRPASLAEAFGVGVPSGEPWNLEAKQLAKWRPALLLADRIYEAMTGLSIKLDRNQPALAEDFPPFFLDEIEKSWGHDKKEELIQSLAFEAPLSLRALRRVGADPLLKKLRSEKTIGVKMERSDFAPMGIRLSGYAPVLNTKAYEAGGFEIQDEGSQWMALFALWPSLFGDLLQNEPGQVNVPEMRRELPESPGAWTVIDACAGAGGKSLALADAVEGKGRIYAYDTSLKKLQALRRRATHAGFTNIQAVALKEGEEADLVKRFRKRAQVVLVDAPCSGWGVLRRNPDIKWRQSEDVRQRMPEIQLRLLSQYSELVVPGGQLIYGVCTFRQSETESVVEKFLSSNGDFVSKKGGFLGPNPCDGFYMRALERKK